MNKKIETMNELDFLTNLKSLRKTYENLFFKYASWMFAKMSVDERRVWAEQTFNFCYILAFSEVVGTVLEKFPEDYWQTVCDAVIRRLDEKTDELKEKTQMLATEEGLRNL